MLYYHMEKFYLYKSNRKDKKYTMVMPTYNHKHHFGGKNYRDFTLINDRTSKHYIPDAKKREQIKQSYISRHKKDKGLGNIHSPAELSMVILWSAPTLSGGIRNYEKKHGVNVIKMF